MTKDIKLIKPNARPKKKKIASLDRRKARSGWFFILPFILGFLLIYASYLPVFFTLTRTLQISPCFSAVKFSYAKLVYEIPYPNGNNGVGSVKT